MAEPILLIEGVVLRSLEGREVFHDLQWILHRGAKVQIQGESGGGATALLRVIAGLAHPQEGRVVLDGTPLDPYGFDHPLLNRGAIGWVPTLGGLIVNMTLLANVALPLRFVKGLERAESEDLALRALEQAGLTKLADQRPHVLDPRERWLGALVRASVMKPELWLVDQPSGDLDRQMLTAASTLLDRALASDATMIVADDFGWVPPQPMQSLRLESGRLNPVEVA